MDFGVDGDHSERWSPSSSGHGRREGTRRVLEVLEGRVVFAEDLLAQDRLMLMALRILEILPNLVNRGVEHAVVSHVYHSFLLRDMDDVPGGLYFVYYLKAVGKDSISRDPDVRFSPTARMRLCA